MPAQFTAASTQFLLNTNATFSAVSPWNTMSVSLWVQPTRLATLERFWFAGNNLASQGVFMSKTVANAWTMGYVDGAGALAASADAGTPVVGKWTFLVGRYDLNRVVAIDGFNQDTPQTIFSATNTSASVIPAAQRSSIGARGFTVPTHFFDGLIAEVAVYKGNIFQSDFNAISAADAKVGFIQQLAFRGPFSLPWSRSRVIEYRSLRRSLITTSDALPDYYVQGNYETIPPNWTNTNGVVLSAVTPPLYSDYVLPSNFTRVGIV